MSVYDRRTFPGLHHDMQLTGDLLGVNCPLYVSQTANMANSVIHPLEVEKMSRKLNSGVRFAHMRGGAA